MEETLFRQELQKRTAAIEELLKEYLPAEEGYQKTVIEAMNYSLMAGGKRLRPMLMQETYKMFGGKDDTILLYSSSNVEFYPAPRRGLR